MYRMRTVLVLSLAACLGCVATSVSPEEESWNEDFIAAQKKSFKGHALVRFVVLSEADKATFDEAVTTHGLDVWDEAPGKHAVARVPPSVDLAQVALKHDVLSPDLEPVLLEESQPAGERFHQKYHSVEEIHGFGEELSKKYPQWVSVESLGHSIEGRPIQVVHVKSASKDAPIVFIQAGQHAREWIGPASTLVALETAAKSAQAQHGLQGFQLSVVPLANPDGYHFTLTKDRMWRKNRNPKHPPAEKPKPWQSAIVAAAMAKGNSKCMGVDLNRNWDAHWGKTLEKGKVVPDPPRPCSETFLGHAATSEPEVRAIADHITANKDRVKGFLDVHSYSQRVLPPGCNGYAISKKDAKEHMRTAQIISLALSKGAAKYQTGPCGKEMYVCSGTAADWAYSHAQVLHSFSVELRPDNSALASPGGSGFVLPPGQIESTGAELHSGITELATQVLAYMHGLV